jgi:hypothetical protein
MLPKVALSVASSQIAAVEASIPCSNNRLRSIAGFRTIVVANALPWRGSVRKLGINSMNGAGGLGVVGFVWNVCKKVPLLQTGFGATIPALPGRRVCAQVADKSA